MVVAGIALFVSLGGTSVAAVSYAQRAGSVDGKSAVSASSTLAHAAGRLVATNSGGTDKGRMPGKFVADVGHTQAFSRSFEVQDNIGAAPQTVGVFRGLGTLTATCNDQNNAVGTENPISIITFINQSGHPVNLARRVGNGDGAITQAPNQTTGSVSIGGGNTFMFHIEWAGQNAIIEGGVRQDGQNTPAGTCAVFGVITQVL
jgi:hypothetical protein